MAKEKSQDQTGQRILRISFHRDNDGVSGQKKLTEEALRFLGHVAKHPFD
jgi:1,4-dihydroxy-2-naphthoyl-CoA synthase